MKKLVIISALLSLVLSCRDDDKGQDEVDKNSLVGKWNLYREEYFENGTLVATEDLKPGSCDYDYYVLKIDGTKDEVLHDPEDNCFTVNYDGTWEYNTANKQVTLVDNNDGYKLISEVISINVTDLKIKTISADGETPPEGIEVFYYLKKSN